VGDFHKRLSGKADLSMVAPVDLFIGALMRLAIPDAFVHMTHHDGVQLKYEATRLITLNQHLKIMFRAMRADLETVLSSGC
jgi:hypothetical protein